MIINIAAASYVLAALAFLLLSLYAFLSVNGRTHGASLPLAAIVTALWAGIIAYDASHSLFLSPLANLLEVSRNAAWFFFLIRLLNVPNSVSRNAHRGLLKASAGLFGFCAILIVATLYGALSASKVAQWLFSISTIGGRVVLAIAGLVLIEQVIRNTRADQRWGIKFLYFGLGGIFAYDFFLYSNAMLFKRVDFELWAARGLVNALVVPLIGISAARNKQWSLDLVVSRRMFFHTAALLGAGVYLLIMAAAGYYLRVFGGTWGAVLQAVFFFGAAILLLALLFSGMLRARVRVFLNKNFFNYTYDYRDEWLRLTRRLSEGESGSLRERAIQAIAELVEVPAGALWMCQDGKVFTRVAHWNMPAALGEEALEGPLARYLEQRQWVINLDEYDSQPERYQGLVLPEWVRSVPRAWLVVPLIVHERLLGFMLLARSLGQVTFNWEVSDMLKTAARQAATNLAQMEASEALIVARQFEGFNRMAAFVVHDLKNLVAQLSLMVANAQKYKHDPEFQDDMISTAENSVEKMNKLLAQLRTGDTGFGNESSMNLASLLRETIDSKNAYRLKPSLQQHTEDIFIRADRERLLRVIGHIIQNAIEATPYDGSVEVRVNRRNATAIIEVVDNGCGMDGAFIRERLFRPFDSTKGSGMGIGAYECRDYIHELGGQVEVASLVGKGTTFRIELPIQANANSGVIQ
jgi:putative PEP-CTERM system histidine kinase